MLLAKKKKGKRQRVANNQRNVFSSQKSGGRLHAGHRETEADRNQLDAVVCVLIFAFIVSWAAGMFKEPADMPRKNFQARC